MARGRGWILANAARAKRVLEMKRERRNGKGERIDIDESRPFVLASLCSPHL